ncbi:MAG: serine/threonine-protein kinase [Nannocystaceae bacterium]
MSPGLKSSPNPRDEEAFDASLRAIVQAFEVGATRPDELPALAELARLVGSGASLEAIRPRFQRLSFDGYLRGALTTVAQSMLAAPRGELALLLARQLIDAIDPDRGLALARAALTLPEVVRHHREISSAYVQINLLVAETMLGRGRVPEARRHFEAILAVDVDHPRGLRGWSECVQKLEERGVETRHRSRGLALLDGLDEVELERNLAGDRYELGRPLGRGRHAVVYEAYDRHVGRQVALKRLLGARPNTDRTTARAIEARFFAEAKTLSRVRSPYVVALLDAQPRHHFIALELCRGGNLRLALRRGQVDAADVPRIAEQLKRALASVHAISAVHRDIKPANILVRDTHADAPIALADFGLALREGPSPGVGAAGTLRYLAPELRRGAEANAATDRFAAGIVLLEIALAPKPLPSLFDLLDISDQAPSFVPTDNLPDPWPATLCALLSTEPEARQW